MKKSFFEKLLYPNHYLDFSALHRKVQGKVIVITGATYGIGERIAYTLATKGITLILVARTQKKLDDMKAELEEKGANVYVFGCDLYELEQVDRLIQEIDKLHVEIDILINNAGKSIRRPIVDSLDRFHDFTRTININYLNPVKLILAFLPSLKKVDGQIINISAINVLLAPAPNWAAYQASKSAMDHWTKSVLPELAAMDVHMTTIYLPLVKTRMIEPTAMYKNVATMAPQQAANIVCQSILNRNKRWKPWWLLPTEIASFFFQRVWVWYNISNLKKRRNDRNI